MLTVMSKEESISFLCSLIRVKERTFFSKGNELIRREKPMKNGEGEVIEVEYGEKALVFYSWVDDAVVIDYKDGSEKHLDTNDSDILTLIRLVVKA